MIPYTLLVVVDSAEWEVRDVGAGRWEALNLSFDPHQADFVPTNHTAESTVLLNLPKDLSDRLLAFLKQSHDVTTSFDVQIERNLKREIAFLIKDHQGEA